MKITTYKCNSCLEVLSDEEKSKPHLSINFGESGLACKHDGSKDWFLKFSFSGIKHFCGPECVRDWLVNRILNLEAK